MILDRHNQFSVKQAITASAPSTDTIDLGPNTWARNSNAADDMPIFLSVAETFASAGATTLQVDVQSSNDVTFATGVVTHASKTYSKAELTPVGKLGDGLILPEDARRYVRLNYTISTGPFTGGRISAGLTTARQTNR